jgi:hypothetical protein
MRTNEKRLVAALLIFAPSMALAQLNQNETLSEPIQLAQAGGGGADPVAEYDALWKEIDGLAVYNALLQRQIQAQQQQIIDLQAAIAGVPEVERQLPPLLLEMVAGLDAFVRLDIPFLTAEREERVAELQLLVERSDVSDAEKFRRILEAWQIETEYGSGFSVTTEQLQINGAPRGGDVLRGGGLARWYRTTDEGAISGAGDPRGEEWVARGSEPRSSIGRALRMARNQIAPDLVLLPMAPAE